jgi:3-oxoacyl-[acyl-carrier-protein] synthase II
VTNAGHHLPAPRPARSQAARATRPAPAAAHEESSEIEYATAHGSSTPLNDPTETLALKQVLGEQAYRVPVSGTKGYYGHALGASGAIEAAICALSLERQWLPPTVNLSSPDPACDLDYVAGSGREADPETILTNSFGFGGINASLVMRRES